MKAKFEIVREIKSNNFERFKELIDKFDDFNDFALINSYKNSLYSKSDDDDELETLPTSGISLLHVAAFYNSLQCFQYLQNAKQIPLRQLSSRNLLPLHYALYAGSIDVSLYILKEDPEESILHPEDSKYCSLLYFAVLGSNLTVVEELFKNGLKLSDPWIHEELIITKVIGRYSDDILSFLWSKRIPPTNDENNKGTYAMRCVIHHNVSSLEIIYDKEYDLNKYFTDRTGYHNLISLIAETDPRNIFKEIYLKILDDAKDISIEPPEEFGDTDGVCHWCCMYNDLDVAKKMLNTKNVKINRFNKSKKTGPFYLIGKKGNDVTAMLELLIQNGFDVNMRFNESYPSLLEGFIATISKNYQAIELLIEYGADINAFHSKHTGKQGNKLTLLQYVNGRNDSKLKKIFNKAEK